MEIITLRKEGITDFAEERNKLLEGAKNDWVLFLDSDERLSGGKLRIKNNAGAYYLRRKNYFLGRYVGTDKLIRLVKRGSGKWVRRVHEMFHLAGDTKAGVIEDLYIIHNTAENLHDYIAKINSYSTLHALANKEEGKASDLFKVLVFPILKFFQDLMKSKHVVFSIMQSLHSFLSWSKLYFLRS